MTLRHLRSSTANKRPTAAGLSDGQLAIAYHADSPGAFFKDSAGAVVKIGPIHVGTTAPNATPAGSSGNSKGEAWLDTSGANPLLKVWNGSAWATVSTVASGTVVTTADTGTVTSTMIADGTITNTDIHATAGITDAKLATIATANKVSAAAIDIDGATDIGSALVDADLILVDDGGAGTNRKAAVTRITDYAFAKVSGDITISSAGAAAIGAGVIVNADINASAAIADTKLATISTAGKVANSATTATNLNTASAIVARDGSGNFTAGTITAALSGNASTATALSSNRSFTLSGDVTGTVSTDLTSGASITTAIAAGAIVNADINAAAAIDDTKLATISTAGKVANSATSATSSNTINTIVARDGSGNFTAGTITAALSGNASTATALSSNRSFTLSGDVTGTVSTNLASGASITTAIAAGAIVNAAISASAEIAVSKLANGTARQLLQTAADGTNVEWATNVDVPGTLDVTGATTFDSTVTCDSTGAITIPDGTTAQRPGSPSAGMIRLNTSLSQFEGYNGTAWGTIGGGAKGGGADQVFFENDQAVTTDYTMTSGKNAVTAGPVTINNGITVTVPSGSVWSIV